MFHLVMTTPASGKNGYEAPRPFPTAFGGAPAEPAAPPAPKHERGSIVFDGQEYVGR